MSLLVDAANLREGGAVQVGAAVMTELWQLAADARSLSRWPLLEGATFLLSPEVAENVHAAPPHGVRIERRTWRQAAARPERLYEASLCVFGPEYSRARARHRVVGCADGLALMPWPQGLAGPSAVQRTKLAAKRAVWLRQAREVTLVVEAEHLRARLIQLGVEPERVRVVPNALHPVFSRASVQPLPAVRRPSQETLLLAYPARGHAHKNHAFLLDLHREVLSEHGLDVRFVVTLRPDEMARLPTDSEAALINVGPQPVGRMPDLYAACDGTIFPSLIETYSVTPLEALASGSPLFASDRPFVRSVTGDAASYFDPLDASSAADALARWWEDDPGRARAVDDGHRLVAGLPDARRRVETYLDFLSVPRP